VAKKDKPLNPLVASFGLRLRLVRERVGLSVNDAASAADMAYSAYARLERGEREPSLSTLLRLSDALGCTPNDLLGYGDAAGT
jgi:transcriptional regulator with XRE-family HTH domain